MVLITSKGEGARLGFKDRVERSVLVERGGGGMDVLAKIVV